MPLFHFRIRDRAKRVLVENEIQEPDLFSASRAIATALALFAAAQGFEPDGYIELEDETGQTVTRIDLKSERSS